MSFPALLLVALGVSADAFAVALGRGVQVRVHVLRTALVVGLTFGLFQALMPVIGWLLGAQLAPLIEPVDHWIAFGLLVLVGGKMLWEAFRGGGDEEPGGGRLRTRELLVLAVATSIDALAVGITFAFLDVSLAGAAALIGVTTALLAFAAVLLGHRVGTRFRTPAEVAGGLVLIAIGTRILLDHLGVL